QQQRRSLARYARRATGPVALASGQEVGPRDVERIQESGLVDRALVQIVRAVQMRPALADISNLSDEMPGQFALYGQAPFMHGRVLDIRIESPDARRRTRRLRSHGEGFGRNSCWGRNAQREAGRDAARQARWR